MSSPDVSVVVPSFGAPPTLEALLRGLRAQTLDGDRYEVLVVDAGADGGIRLLERLQREWDGPPLRVIRGPLAGGPAARRNRGAAEARGSVLAFTDTDCEPDPPWLEAGLDASRSGAELVQGRTLPPEGVEIPPFAHHHRIEREHPLYESCNVFYERRLFERLGGFSPRYFAHLLEPFGEDVELAWRARRAGARVRFEPRAVVRHAVRVPSLGAHFRYLWRGRGFPMLVRDVPELREAFLYKRVFLSRRSARFAAAAAGLALSRRRPTTALLALPYARLLASELPVGEVGAGRAAHVARSLASDAVTAAALAYGSLRWREPVL